MPHTCKLQLPEGVVVSLAFSDFNRLRWAVDALGVNPALRRHLAEHCVAAGAGLADLRAAVAHVSRHDAIRAA